MALPSSPSISSLSDPEDTGGVPVTDPRPPRIQVDAATFGSDDETESQVEGQQPSDEDEDEDSEGITEFSMARVSQLANTSSERVWSDSEDEDLGDMRGVSIRSPTLSEERPQSKVEHEEPESPTEDLTKLSIGDPVTSSKDAAAISSGSKDQFKSQLVHEDPESPTKSKKNKKKQEKKREKKKMAKMTASEPKSAIQEFLEAIGAPELSDLIASEHKSRYGSRDPMDESRLVESRLIAIYKDKSVREWFNSRPGYRILVLNGREKRDGYYEHAPVSLWAAMVREKITGRSKGADPGGESAEVLSKEPMKESAKAPEQAPENETIILQCSCDWIPAKEARDMVVFMLHQLLWNLNFEAPIPSLRDKVTGQATHFSFEYLSQMLLSLIRLQLQFTEICIVIDNIQLYHSDHANEQRVAETKQLFDNLAQFVKDQDCSKKKANDDASTYSLRLAATSSTTTTIADDMLKDVRVVNLPNIAEVVGLYLNNATKAREALGQGGKGGEGGKS